MPNYNQITETVEIVTYQRSNKVIIENELNQAPTITFMEQIIKLLPDGATIQVGKDKCYTTMTNPYGTFPLLNPTTDEVVGDAAYIEVYALLYSLYRSVADARDEARVLAVTNSPIE